jgi:endonuclease/exonuclease/phosphatase (EEP) superfamily protein YafD
VFQFHLGLVLLAIVGAALVRRRKRLALVALPPLLFTLGPALLQFVPQRPEPSVEPRFRVMTANLLMVNGDTDGIIGEVRAAKPDLLLLQEYTAGWHQAFQSAIAADYPYSSVVMRDDSFGIAVYSRTPFVGDVDQRFPLGRAGVEQMRGEIEVGRQRLAFYDVHLLPPRTLLYTGEHRLQLADLVDALKNEKLPYVVCGDFNFPDLSPQQSALKRAGAREAHQLAGYGRGATWPVNGPFRYIVPGVRIDHVYLSPQLTATTCETGEGRGSDHRPVVVDVAFRAGT